MNFRLITILWLFALLASAMGTFGAGVGVVAATAVVLLAIYLRRGGKTQNSVVGFLALLALLFVVSGMNPSPEVTRAHCQNYLRQIMAALNCYEASHGSFPPAYTVDEDGRPLHSWRVLLLPYLDEQAMYESIDLKKRWDDPVNLEFADQMPVIYRCPACDWFSKISGLPCRSPEKGETSYFAVVGSEAVMTLTGDRSCLDVTDGPQNSVVLIEAADRCRNWMAPEDLTVGEAMELLSSPNSPRHLEGDVGLFVSKLRLGVGNVVYADGHAEFLSTVPTETAQALVTAAGGETIADEIDRDDEQPRYVTIVHWGHIFSFALFVTLSLAPMLQLRQPTEQTA